MNDSLAVCCLMPKATRGPRPPVSFRNQTFNARYRPPKGSGKAEYRVASPVGCHHLISA